MIFTLYLDNAATTAKKPLRVMAKMIYETLFCSFNIGRGVYGGSLRAAESMVKTQERIAELINVPNPQNIAFMPNATYALNAAILGSRAKRAVISQMEHNSVIRPVHSLDAAYDTVPADKEGYVSAEGFKKLITKDTDLVICTHASNVCGTIEPAAAIAETAHAAGALFLLDASQTLGAIEIDNSVINADFIAFPGHKGLMAPLGSGGLYVKDINTLEPVITGGTGSLSESPFQPRIMPDMLHPGTLNSPVIAAMGEAAVYVKRSLKEISEREREAADTFEREMRERLDRKVIFYGAKHKTGVCAFNIEGINSAVLQERLRGKIAMRTGYHCAPGAHTALGTAKTGSARVSFGAFDSLGKAKKAADLTAKAALSIYADKLSL